MQTYQAHTALRAERRPTAVAIGIFDGVHRGHQALVARTLALAAAHGLRSLIYTFHPHPARVLNAPLAPQLIEPLPQRLERLERLGVDAVCVQAFDRGFAATQAADFVRQVLVDAMQARHVVVGAGFTFGSRQGGHVGLLQEMGAELGFAAHPVDHVRVEGIEASSTRVREFIHSGQPRGAALLLGRPFALFGVIERGAQRGTGLGFPTANLRVENELMPLSGVYAGRARIGDDPTVWRAVINVGVAPTFGGQPTVRVEAHLLGYSGGPLYERSLQLELVERLRDEQRFSGVEALKAQIQRDVETAEAVLAGLAKPT